MAQLDLDPMKSGCKATTLLGTQWCMHASCKVPRMRPEPLTSTEKRRWFGRRCCMPGDGGLGSSPLSVGEKVLHSGWGSLPRGPSCKSERERHQLPSLPLCPRGRGSKSRSPSVLPQGQQPEWSESKEGFRAMPSGHAADPHPHCASCGAGCSAL